MTIKYDVNKRLYKNVAASSSETLDYVPADGEQLLVMVLGGDSSSSPETNCCVLWDQGGGAQEILFSTYADAKQENVHHLIIGDGVKILRIMLQNDLTESVLIGAYWQAEILNG